MPCAKEICSVSLPGMTRLRVCDLKDQPDTGSQGIGANAVIHQEINFTSSISGRC